MFLARCWYRGKPPQSSCHVDIVSVNIRLHLFFACFIFIHSKDPVFKHWYQREISISFPSSFIFHIFLPNSYLKNVILTPHLTEEPCCLLTPPPTIVLTPASCSLGLVVVVNVLVELCDVGGKRDGVGAVVWNAVPLEGGMGWRLSSSDLLLK